MPELSSSEERDGKEPQRNLAVRLVQETLFGGFCCCCCSLGAQTKGAEF
ncbi:hypothetical protein JMJ77_0011738 [Colletotrichum scovillei]|uniref:Uncharacterized protein n=1 Tax=Colletotrichum scovillei TaxID=1209932 RepID=A0A9P7UDC0_9PEZI|nr:hypothetical protein JMJ77_0011738 [Colletotrichum scovillei]KAG7046017.1 hypothetical protein JMJ78_0011087 [Colletotrichum scovillei]KAG7063366.1 hypothetical protein JMJ76_0005833 [Colletotrichum scovillei]